MKLTYKTSDTIFDHQIVTYLIQIPFRSYLIWPWFFYRWSNKYLDYFDGSSAITSIVLCIYTTIGLCNIWDNNWMLRIYVQHLFCFLVLKQYIGTRNWMVYLSMFNSCTKINWALTREKVIDTYCHSLQDLERWQNHKAGNFLEFLIF